MSAEVCHAVAYEGALHVDDVLTRRTHIAFEVPDRGHSAADGVAKLMAPVLGWDQAVLDREIAHYRARLEAEAAAAVFAHRRRLRLGQGPSARPAAGTLRRARRVETPPRHETPFVWINGRLEPAGEALLTVTDRGFQVETGSSRRSGWSGDGPSSSRFTPAPGCRLPPPCSRSRSPTVSSDAWTAP